jgi:hypothetical protein
MIGADRLLQGSFFAQHVVFNILFLRQVPGKNRELWDKEVEGKGSSESTTKMRTGPVGRGDHKDPCLDNRFVKAIEVEPSLCLSDVYNPYSSLRLSTSLSSSSHPCTHQSSTHTETQPFNNTITTAAQTYSTPENEPQQWGSCASSADLRPTTTI